MALFSPTDFTITIVAGQRFISLAGGGGGAPLRLFNVADYGMLDDDITLTGAANKTACDAALAALQAQGGGALYFPWMDTGKYRIDGVVTVPDLGAETGMVVICDPGVQLRSVGDDAVFYVNWVTDIRGAPEFIGLTFKPVTSGQGVGIHVRDTFHVQTRNCKYYNLRRGEVFETLAVWTEGWITEDNFYNNCTVDTEFLKSGSTGSFQSGRMTRCFHRPAPGGTGVKVGSGAVMYACEFDAQYWPDTANGSIAIEFNGDANRSIWTGIVDAVGAAAGATRLALKIGSTAINMTAMEYAVEHAGSFAGGNEESSSVLNSSVISWVHDVLPYGNTRYVKNTLLTTTGDTTYASAANTWARRGIGSAGDISKVAGGVPTWAAPAALTKVDDTNVTLTLTGSPATSLVNAAGLTLGWTGQLAVARGGIGVGTLASNGVLYGNGTGAVQALAVNATATNKYLQQVSSGAPTWATIPASEITSGAALTKVDDTNVTATLGGTPASALLVAASITLGWTGTLAQARGGTGSATPFANPSASVGLAAVNGAATTFMRSDAAPALSQAIAPTWTDFHAWSGTLTMPTLAGGIGRLDVRGTLTPTQNGDAGLLLINTMAPASDLSIVGGLYSQPTFAPLVSQTANYGLFLDSQASPPVSVTITDMITAAMRTRYANVSGAVTTGTTLLVFSPSAAGSLKPTTHHGIRVRNQGLAGMTTSYGVHIEAQSGSTTPLALYSAGGENRIVGNTRFGANTAPVTTVDVTGAVNATTGYQQNGLATSGSYLRGDGSNIILNTIQVADLPAHSASSHTDRTSSIFIPADLFQMTQGTRDFALHGSSGNTYEKFWALALDGSVDEICMATVELPTEWVAGGSVVVSVWWCPSDGSGGNVFFQTVINDIAAGDQMDKAIVGSTQAIFAAGTTAEAAKFSSLAAITVTNRFLNLYLWRIGSNVLDTYDAHDVWIRGIRLSYTNDQ